MNLFGRRRPTFSVVIATYNRDELIVPTLESVRRQSFTDFEVLVVSDGPPTPALGNVVGGYDDRFRLLVLPQRSRSQAGPNNLGWEAARGDYVAYLGHDDIWHPEHLQRLASVYRQQKDTHFAVSGCLFLGPAGTGDHLTWVTGIFEPNDTETPRTFFFPPSALSHRRELPEGVRRWSDPAVTRRPVDTEFLLGAVEHGCAFRSTGEITVFKFASALRYLSYLCPGNEEQRDMLELLDDPAALAGFVAERVAAAREHGGYMAPRHASPDQFAAGEVLRINEAVRGIAKPEMQPLEGPAHLEVGDDYRAFDWFGRETDGAKSWRWSGPNHRPRLLLPYTCGDLVRVTLRILRFATPDIAGSLRIFVNGDDMSFTSKTVDGIVEVSMVVRLRRDVPSVLELRMNRTAPASEIDPETNDSRHLGLCLSGVELTPERH